MDHVKLWKCLQDEFYLLIGKRVLTARQNILLRCILDVRISNNTQATADKVNSMDFPSQSN